VSETGLRTHRAGYNAPTFTLKNRALRTAWRLAWFLGARWTPPPLHFWRNTLLNWFGARVAMSARIYSSVDVWAPWNLTVAEFGSLGPAVRCYNIAPISIGYKAVVSQGVHLCTGTHDYRDPAFTLVAKPVSVGARAWICADAFVGPGVTVGEGAVLAAAGAAFHDLDPWTVYVGNPAAVRRARPVINDSSVP
jgi:putative colanic acid biosynthesis acetyltransferase WcaF